MVASEEDGCCILFIIGMGSAALQVCGMLHFSPCRRIQDGRPQTLEVQEASIFPAASFSGARIHFPDVLHHVGLKVHSSFSVQLCVLHVRKHRRSGRSGSHLVLRADLSGWPMFKQPAFSRSAHGTLFLIRKLHAQPSSAKYLPSRFFNLAASAPSYS